MAKRTIREREEIIEDDPELEDEEQEEDEEEEIEGHQLLVGFYVEQDTGELKLTIDERATLVCGADWGSSFATAIKILSNSFANIARNKGHDIPASQIGNAMVEQITNSLNPKVAAPGQIIVPGSYGH
jgi:hypothetical protein